MGAEGQKLPGSVVTGLDNGQHIWRESPDPAREEGLGLREVVLLSEAGPKLRNFLVSCAARHILSLLKKTPQMQP